MDFNITTDTTNVIHISGDDSKIERIELPQTEKIINKANKLSEVSKYPFNFDLSTYAKLEERFLKDPVRGGITFKTPFKIVNSHPTCQQCLYAFEVDTYGRGCTHDCVYCYAKAELSVHGYWNRPFPMPVDITDVWKTFYTVFETDRKSKWREVMEKRIPIRIGSMSDSFMWMDKKYKVTQEFLKILDFYKYPYIIFTRSDLIAKTPYIDLLNPDLCSVQMSIASTNDKMNKLIEPGTPSSKRRLEALQTLVRNGFWTTVRLNPFFPIYPDGYFSNPNFDRDNIPDPFEFSSFEMVDEIAQYGVQSILAGMVRLSSFAINNIEKATGYNLRDLYNTDGRKSQRDFHFTNAEVRAYYERIHAKCIQNNIQFTTCYIGNGENQFWRDQDLWTNKKDCCNAIDRIINFSGSSSRDISWDTRIKFTNHKCLTANDSDNLHKELSPLVIDGSNIYVNPELKF